MNCVLPPKKRHVDFLAASVPVRYLVPVNVTSLGHGTFTDVIEVRRGPAELGRALIPRDRRPHEKRRDAEADAAGATRVTRRQGRRCRGRVARTPRAAGGAGSRRKARNGFCSGASRKGAAPSTPRPRTSDLESAREYISVVSSYPFCSDLLWQPREAHTAGEFHQAGPLFPNTFTSLPAL